MIHVEGVKDDMIANNLTPFYSTHPGEVIKDELVTFHSEPLLSRLVCHTRY